MAQNKYFGVKYPFTTNNDNGLFLDMNTTQDEELKSQILHVIMTPKGTRIRMPEFGTDLIRFIFNPNDSLSWSEIKEEIQKEVALFVPKANLINIEVLRGNGEANGVFVMMEYQVKRGNMVVTEKAVVKV